MKKLMIIADDFTGALDTAVVFSAFSVRVKVVLNFSSISVLSQESDIMVVNTDSRHMNCDDAYKCVYDIARIAKESGFSYIYKKVDSGLRGNVGAELSAVMDAYGQDSLHFIPAYPKMNRITRNGYHYINGKLLEESIFAEDPFEPAKSSSIFDVVSKQTSKKLLKGFQKGNGIHIYDAVTEDDLSRIAATLGPDNLRLCSGCAGFAPYLATVLGFDSRNIETINVRKPLIVISGSLNQVSINQIEKAAAIGYKRFSLSKTEKADPDFITSFAGKKMLENVKHSVLSDGVAIIDVNSGSPFEEKNARQRVASLLGSIAKALLDMQIDAIFFLIGGDTLKAMTDEISCNEISIVCEIGIGMVLNKIMYKESEIFVISKSGGFGDENLLIDLINNEEKKIC